MDTYTPTVTDVLHFLTEQYHLGIGYSAISTVRSALSTFIFLEGFPAGSHPLVRRFLKGVFNLRPALPKYETTWDTSLVLKYLKKLSPVKRLDFKMLTFKLIMLFALLTGQRSQTLHLLSLDDMILTKNSVKFKLSGLLKHSRPGKHLDLLVIRAFAPDRRLCPITVLLEYLRRTQTLRATNRKLFIGIIRPHGPVTSSTIARWIKLVIIYSGIDPKTFSAHSTRGASSSKAALANVPLNTIMKTAGWSRKDTFAVYYNKPITEQGQFGLAILNDANT